jgi:uncharacterized protein (DUF2141 family)
MKYLLIFLPIILLFSCAQFVPPTGGENDKIPPELLRSSPVNKSKNFNEKNITLTFNEYLDITSLKQELLITPEPKSLYNVKLKDKTIKLIFDEKLDSNTTYTFNFRNGIKDLNEKNPSKNLKIVLSTGSKIDSLGLTGTITDIQTKNPVLETTVGLYATNDTISILKRKPNYFTKTDSSGKYQFENIKNNKYVIIAFSDKNQNLIYDIKTETIGFLKDTINLDSNMVNINLETYKANYTKNKVKRSISRENSFVVQLDKEIIKTKINFQEIKDTLDYTFNSNSVTFFKVKPIPKDTIYANLIVTDSLNTTDTLQQKIYFTTTNNTNKKKNLQNMSIISNIKNGENLKSKILYDIKFEYPITKFDTSKIIFKTDTLVIEKPIFKFKNSTNLQILINTKAKKQIELYFPSNTITNYKGDTNSIFYLKNNILLKENLGLIAGITKDKKGIKIVQLLNAETNEIIHEQTTQDKFQFNDLIPGSYLIKLIYDENKNGIWDPGNITTGKQPEKISLRKEQIRVRANFEIKDIELN